MVSVQKTSSAIRFRRPKAKLVAYEDFERGLHELEMEMAVLRRGRW